MLEINDLTRRLQEDVPRRSKIPTDAQYEDCVRDAILDYSRRKPIRKIDQLDIVAGTAAYDLPTDFLRIIKIETLEDYPSFGRTLISPTGKLVPLPLDFPEEEYNIQGKQIVFTPTPTSSWEGRYYWYAAIHEEDDGQFSTLENSDAMIFMDYAQALALIKQANKLAREAGSHRTADVQETKSMAQELREQAQFLIDQYAQKLAGPTRSVMQFTPTQAAKVRF